MPHTKLVSLATTENMAAPDFFRTCPEQRSGLRIQLISCPRLDRYDIRPYSVFGPWQIFGRAWAAEIRSKAGHSV